MSGTVVALASLCFTLLLTLIGVVWKASAVVAKLTAALAHVEASVKELRDGLAALKNVPILETRVGALENVATHQQRKIDDLWRKVFSLDKHMAVQRERSASRPEIVTGDSDPPPNNTD